LLNEAKVTFGKDRKKPERLTDEQLLDALSPLICGF